MKKRYEYNQVDLVENHLLENGTITSWDAFEKYGITRLSAKIYQLRKKYNIESVTTTKKNRYGHWCNFSTYTLRGVSNDNQE